MLDFLKEIVEGVADPSAGGTIDLDGENGEGAKKKRVKGKKAAASDGAGSSGGAPADGDQQPLKKKRRKKSEAQAGTRAAAAPTKQSKPRKMEAVVFEGDRDRDMEERSDPDHKMEDPDEYEDDRSAGYGGYSRADDSSRPGEGESEWRDEDEPFMPRS